MKVLVATARSQGHRDNDFAWTIDSELVYLGAICDRDGDDPDGECGCARAFSGVMSGKAVTTAEVRDLDVTYEELVDTMRSALADRDWKHDAAGDIIADVLDTAADYDAGTVLERRGDDVQTRAGTS